VEHQRRLIMRLNGKSRWRRAAGIVFALGEAMAAISIMLALAQPASAQFWGSWDRGWGRPQQRQQSNPFGNWWGPSTPQYDNRPQREAPTDYSHAPPPQRKQEVQPSTTIVVIGDAMADWLASGLEDAFAEKPEIGILRKHRTTSGLIRYEPRRETEWAQAAREIIAADKPKYIVMMIGLNDRQAIRERAPTPAPASTSAAPAKAGAAKPAPPPPAKPSQADLELQAQASADQQNAELQLETGERPADPAPEPGRPNNPNAGASGLFEFHTEQWEAAYIKRIDATMAAMKSAGVPVFWVGLPAVRGARASSDAAYLNELYRGRAERAGIVYVDVWDGFVDEAGRFTPQGPDFEGQIRRLRSGDGVYFTKAGARKLAHYVEREIQRSITTRAIPVALPAPEPAPATPGTPGARPGGPTPRPLAGPVVPLTVSTTGADELLGGTRAARPAAADPVATRVLTKGEPIAAPTGRADDFSWPRGSSLTAEPAASPASLPPTPETARSTTPPPAAGAPKSGSAATGAVQRTTTDGQNGERKPPVQRRPRPTVPAAEAPPRPPLSIGPAATATPGTLR